MSIRGKPWLALIESSAHLAAVVIEDPVPAVDTASQAGPRDFHLGRFVAR